MVTEPLAASHQLIASKHHSMEDLLPSLVAVAEKVELLYRMYRQ
jgi:hypothetical protein